MSIFEEKPYKVFKRIILYCKLMNYDINDILKMSDNELKIWYKRISEKTKSEIDFRINTGLTLGESQCKKDI